jgi:hypothetical protein
MVFFFETYKSYQLILIKEYHLEYFKKPFSEL